MEVASVLAQPKEVYPNFEAFKKSFVRKKDLYGWISADCRVRFFRTEHTGWIWSLMDIQMAEQKLIDDYSLQTYGFKTRVDAVDYVKVCFPGFDLSKVEKDAGMVFSNPEKIVVGQNKKGVKKWRAYRGTDFFLDNNDEILVGKTFPDTLRKIWAMEQPG